MTPAVRLIIFGSTSSASSFDALAPGVPGALSNQSATTDVTPTIRIALNTAGGVLSNIATDVVTLYANGASVGTRTLDATDISNGYCQITCGTEQYGLSTGFTANSAHGAHVSPTSSVLTVSYDYIGIIGHGQSNWLGHTSQGTSPPAASEGTACWDNTNSIWISVPAVNGLREMANAVNTLTGKAVRIVYGGQSGTAISGLILGTQPFTDLAARITASGIRGDYIVWHQGEGDSANGTVEATYQSRLSTGIHQAICDLMSRTKAQCKLIVASLALTTAASGTSEGTDTTWDGMNRTLLDVEANLSNAYFSHTTQDAVLDGSGIHWDAASYGRSGKRFGYTIAFVHGDVATRPRYFITAATIVDTTHTDITIVHSMGTDFTPTSAIKGFIISGDNGATYEVPSAAVRQSATSIRLTHSSMATSNNRLARYLYGLAPDTSAMVVDNGTINAPLAGSYGTFTAAGSAALPTPTYIGVKTSGASFPTGSQVKWTSVGIGTASNNRFVMISIAKAESTTSGLTAATLQLTGQSDIALTVQNCINTNGCLTAFAFGNVPAAYGATLDALILTFGAAIFATPQVAVWTVDQTTLNSTTPVGFGGASSASASSINATLATSSGGFILATGANNNAGETSIGFSGTETFALRDNVLFAGGRHGDADASNTATNASSTVTATFGLGAAKCGLGAISFR